MMKVTSTITRAGLKRCSSTLASTGNAFDVNAYCLNIVKTHDFESYLVGLLLPRKTRDSFFAVRAFNVEISQIKDQIPRNAAAAGRIRFQFWKDVISGIFEGKGVAGHINHPVANALRVAIETNQLSIKWFNRAIEARYKDAVTEEKLISMDDIENYGEFTQSSLLYLILELLGVKNEQADTAASHIGVGTGIVTLLRATPYHSANGNIYMPQELMRKHSVSTKILLKGPNNDEELTALKNITNDIASQSYAHLQKGKEIVNSLKSDQAFPAFLPYVPSMRYLDTLKDCDFDPFKVESATNRGLHNLNLQYNLLKAKIKLSL